VRRGGVGERGEDGVDLAAEDFARGERVLEPGLAVGVWRRREERRGEERSARVSPPTTTPPSLFLSPAGGGSTM
jgi:hypothetical protein